MKKEKTILIIIVVALILLAASWYYYKLYTAGPSFVLAYPINTKTDKIKNDIYFLKEKKYTFLGASELIESLSNNRTVKSRSVLVTVHNLPNDELVNFFRRMQIPAIFFIRPDQIPSVKKYKNLEFGLKPSFPAPRQKNTNAGYISINFDDGWRSVYENALPVLKEARLPASIFAISKPIIKNNFKYLSAEQLITMQDEGWDIGSHSFDHEHFNQISLDEAEYSLTASKGFLEGMGLYTRGFAFPYGEYNAKTLMMAQKYFSYLRLSDNEYNPKDNKKIINGFILNIDNSLNEVKKQINWAKKNKAGLVFVFHEVTDNGREYSIQPSKFKKIVELIKKSGLPIHTNIGLIKKPLFLRQENGKTIESKSQYVERIRQVLNDQKIHFRKNGLNAEYILYTEGIITDGLEKAADKSGFKLGFTGRIGFLDNSSKILNIKTIILREKSVKSIFEY